MDAFSVKLSSLVRRSNFTLGEVQKSTLLLFSFDKRFSIWSVKNYLLSTTFCSSKPIFFLLGLSWNSSFYQLLFCTTCKFVTKFLISLLQFNFFLNFCSSAEIFESKSCGRLHSAILIHIELNRNICKFFFFCFSYQQPFPDKNDCSSLM